MYLNFRIKIVYIIGQKQKKWLDKRFLPHIQPFSRNTMSIFSLTDPFCALVFIDGKAGEHVNITSWYDKDNMYYFLKSPFSPYLKFQTRVHTLSYLNNIQWITVNGVKSPDINCHNDWRHLLRQGSDKRLVFLLYNPICMYNNYYYNLLKNSHKLYKSRIKL